MQNTYIYIYTHVMQIEIYIYIYVYYIISKLCKYTHAYMPLSHPFEQEEPKGRFRSKMESWTLLPEGARVDSARKPTAGTGKSPLEKGKRSTQITNFWVPC